MDTLFHDLRFALRSLRRQPLFTAAAVLVLALGIGANVAVFSVIYSVLLQPLPYPQSERLLLVREHAKGLGLVPLSYPDYVDLQAAARSFTELAVQRRGSFGVAFQPSSGIAPERIAGAEVSANFLTTLDARPKVGRDLQASDDVPGAAPVALLGDALWRRRFAASPQAIGQTITVEGVAREIVGIVPPQVDLPHAAELFIPLANLRADAAVLNRGNHFGFRPVGRLKPGVSVAQAQAELNNLFRELARRYPDTNGQGSEMDARTLLEGTVGDYHNSLFLLLAAVGCVLLIACANVANLYLARATGRQKEMAVRAALGASRWRLARQMLMEGVLLGFLGAAVAMLLAFWALAAIDSLVPPNLPRFHETRLGLPAFACATLAALGTGLLVGIWSAWRMSANEAMTEALRQGSTRGGTGGAAQHRTRSLLVVAQMTMAVVLLAGAGLTLRSFYHAMTEPLGFNPEGLLTLTVSLPKARYDKVKKDQFTTQLLDRVRALPGVTSASMADHVPFDDQQGRFGFHITGTPPALHNADAPTAERSSGTPDYFKTMGILIVRGRAFDERDTAGQAPSLIVDETFARAYFRGQDPIGQHLDDESAEPGETRPPYTIVGVAAHVRTDTPSQSADVVNTFQFYLCNTQSQSAASTLSVRVAAGDPLRLIEPVRQSVMSLDREVPVANASTMTDIISREFAPRRLTMVLLAVFGGLALVLASVGLYAVTSLGVSQRTRELGIRLALGAQRKAILGLVLRQGMALVGIGLAIGLLVAMGAGRLLSSLLYGVSSNDLITLAGVSVILAAAALLACWLPARRAMLVDPMVALRDE